MPRGIFLSTQNMQIFCVKQSHLIQSVIKFLIDNEFNQVEAYTRCIQYESQLNKYYYLVLTCP